jgi:hypothetical protein
VLDDVAEDGFGAALWVGVGGAVWAETVLLIVLAVELGDLLGGVVGGRFFAAHPVNQFGVLAKHGINRTHANLFWAWSAFSPSSLSLRRNGVRV